MQTKGWVIYATCGYTLDANLPLQGKRVVSEKPEKKPVSVDIKCPPDDGQAKSVELAARGKQLPHVSKREPLAQVWIRAPEPSRRDQCAPSALAPFLLILLRADGFQK